MATRKSEWLASIKPILDKDEAKKDAVALARELGDILEVKVDATPENLSELAKEFNEQLKIMGKQPIVFSEKTLRGIVSQFTQAVSAGISAGIKDGIQADLKDSLQKLQLEQANLKKEKARIQSELSKKVSNQEKMRRLLDFDGEKVEPLEIDGDVLEEAKKQYTEFIKKGKELSRAQKEYGVDSKEYVKMLYETEEALHNLYRIQKNLKKLDTPIPQSIKAAYGLLDPYTEQPKYEEAAEKAGRKPMLPFYETSVGDFVGDSWERFVKGVKKDQRQLDDIDNKISVIDTKIVEVTRAIEETGNVTDSIIKSGKNGIKTLDEISEAYKRLKKNKDAALRDQNLSRINTALNYDPKEKDGIKTFAQDYYDSAASGDWVEEYRALLRYVKLYESYLHSDNKAHRNKVTAKNNPFTPLYEQLKPMAENARNMLQNIINMSEDKPLVGVGEANIGPTDENVADAQKLSAESEKIASADRDAAEAAKQKRIEEEKIAETLGRAADEAERELKAKKEGQSYVGYRAVQPPTGSRKTKADALEDWGAEYFSTAKEVAASYGEDFYEKGDIIIGEITPKHPLIINANGVRWDEFEKMSDINKLFPELLDLIKSNPNWTGDDKQKYINERARVMGYDAVVIENVNDSLYGDKQQIKLSTTIAVLDDRIVSLTGSMKQLEAGTNRFSDVVASEIPSYYITGSQNNENAAAEVQDVGTAFRRIIDYINSSGQRPQQFFDSLEGDAKVLNEELKEILSTLGLLDSQGNVNLKSIQNGFMNLGGMVSDTYTLIARGKDYLPKSKDLMPKLMNAKEMGANVGTIIDVIEDEAHGKIYELQSTVSGEAIKFSGNTEFLEATDEQILKLIQDLEILKKAGLYIDFGGDNIFYDKEKGFSFIDLATRPKEGQETVEKNVQKMLKFFKPDFGADSRFDGFANKLNTALEASTHRDNAEAIKEETEAQEELNHAKKGQPYSGTIYHGSKTSMDDTTYDASKGNGLKNMGSGLYFTPDLEQAAKHGKNILQQSVQLENVFTFTEEFITDIDALYKAMGKIKPADVDWKTVKSDLLNTMKLPGKAQEFAKNMREMGYQGMYSKGYGYADPNVEQLAIYDENYQKNLSTKPYSEIVNGVQNETNAHQQNSEAVKKETSSLEGKLTVLNQISTAYNRLNSVQDDYDNADSPDKLEAKLESAKEAVQDLEREYYSAIVTMQDGSRVDIPLDEEFSETAQDILADAKKIQNVELVPRSAEKAIQAYEYIERAQGNIVSALNRTWSHAQNGNGVNGLEYLNRTKQQLDMAVSHMDQADPDGKWDFSNANQTAKEFLATIESMLPKFAMIVQLEQNLKDLDITPDEGQYYDVIEGIKNNTFTTVDQCIAKFQEFKDVVKVQPTGDGSRTTTDSSKPEGAINTSGQPKSSIEAEELKNILGAITYNVKVVQDTENTDNKISIDETSLEATLNKVFANILNPQTEQNDSKQEQAPWALESTLNTTIKGVLDNIQTNTAKIGTVETSNADAIAGTALDNKLTEIKSVLDSIDNKIAKGGVITKKGDDSTKKTEPDEDANKQTGRSVAMKSLIGDYERLGKLRAQFEKDDNLETKARLKNLAAEVESKRESLNLTSDEILELRRKSDLAYKSEQRLIDAAKAQKEIDDQRKAAAQDAKKQAKDAEAAWKKQVKDAQRATGINAATSAVNAGDQTVVRAIGTEGISKDIENKAKELSERIKELRVLRDEIDEKGEQATNEDRDNLSKRIAKVKELKTEVDGYLKIHEKYSGEGVEDLGDASGFGAVGTDQYWNNITAAIKNASTGRVTIKGMNTDTGELTGTTKIAANTFAEWSATVDPVTGKLSMLRTGIKRTETIIEQITRKTKEIFTYFSGSSIIFKAFNELKKGIQYVREIDLALTELKKVTDETEESYDKFLKTAAKTAEKVGSTIQKVVSSTADWARLGSILAKTNIRPII